MSSGGDEFRVRRLKPHDDRSGFRSGNIDLDRFFQRYTGQNKFRHHIGTTYVAVQRDQIVGLTTVYRKAGPKRPLRHWSASAG